MTGNDVCTAVSSMYGDFRLPEAHLTGAAAGTELEFERGISMHFRALLSLTFLNFDVPFIAPQVFLIPGPFDGFPDSLLQRICRLPPC